MSLRPKSKLDKIKPGEEAGSDFQLPGAEKIAPTAVNANRKAGASANMIWGLVVGALVVAGGYMCFTLMFPAAPNKAAQTPQTYTPTVAAASPALAVNPTDEQASKINQLSAEKDALQKQRDDAFRMLSARDNEPKPSLATLDTRAVRAGLGLPGNAAGVSVGAPSMATGGAPALLGAAVGPGAAGSRPSRGRGGLTGADRASMDADGTAGAPQAASWTVTANGSSGDGKSGAGQGTGLPPPSSQAGYGLNKTALAGSTSKSVSTSLEVYDSTHFVPPNAYVEATVIVGVDAAAGTSFSADPKPVLFRLHGPAVHVGGDGHHQTTNLDGCEVSGAAYAELSSEKVYIKLQKITCPVAAGKFSVATVEGYVSSRGKAGVRGKVISREGQLTTKALVAGTLQGLGQAMSLNVQRSQSGQIGTTGPGGVLSSQELSPGQIAQGAVGTGISSASSMLANYYIQRAEQYQPVIEMPTGINVTLVFLNGFQVR